MEMNPNRVARLTLLFGIATLLIVAFQNCQNGGNAMMSLQECNVGDCTDGGDDPGASDIDNLQTQISDGGTGILQMNKDETSFSFYASCYYSGFTTPRLNVTISRSGTGQQLTGTFPCTSSTVQISFTGMDTAFGLPGQTGDASIFVAVQGYDDQGVLQSGGTDSATLQFVTTEVPPPPPGATPAITIASIYRYGDQGQDLQFYAKATSFTPDQMVGMIVQYTVNGNTYTVNPPQARANAQGDTTISALLTQGAAELWKQNINFTVKMVGGTPSNSRTYRYGGDAQSLKLIRIAGCSVSSTGLEVNALFLKPQTVQGTTARIWYRNVSTGNQEYSFDQNIDGLDANGGYRFVLDKTRPGLEGAPNDRYVIRAEYRDTWSAAFYLNGTCQHFDNSF